MQKLEKIFAQKKRSKSARIAKLSQFLQGHSKPVFSEKVQRGDQDKVFKNREKVALAWKAQQYSGENGIIL